ncbi:P-loop containing nucleoside triphosphate hydrolase protein [Phycomyces nitens]|nr:P-loop containing nucleoside triphosphate hydrolase protein [Phycomyces nitens]
MSLSCIITDPWTDSDFSPCFREIVLDSALPLGLLIICLFGISKAWLDYHKSNSSLYTPLKDSLPTFSYGATPTNRSIDHDNDASSSASTIAPEYERKSLRWTVISWTRLLSGFQAALYITSLIQLVQDTYPIDVVEGTKSQLIISYSSMSVFWSIAFLIAVGNIVISGTPNDLTPRLCSQMNVLYCGAFLLGMADLRSFYIGHGIDDIGVGYTVSLYSSLLSLVLIMCAFNEEPLAPVSPIVSDSGRTMSSENWASVYSQFMFGWVNVMMKEGYRRTLDDKDLVELPAENRAKNTLADFRKHKSPKMAIALLKNFKWLIIHQFIYCMFWSVIMFGPPYFLNKIIKYIEYVDPAYQVPTLTAFLYVFGLFAASTIQSLALQQALYIGRTIGIRIQAIAIGEVFAKSLRRRDQTGSQDVGADDKKGNVNNLLSVDAQKLAEFSAYIFYVYSYPIQIIISVWGLYKLLGNASLWGVLVMVVTQPFTYLISNHFEKLQDTVMTATDRRLKLMNELLAAIRIVKFFAWEKQFKNRVVEAREVELKAIRGRLMAFMWMSNIWFFIPILIMVTVFYVYTQTSVLTASVAFTALALFNSFRSAMDELPMIITFSLQANVSLRRIEAFLAEEEVETVETESSKGVYAGFVDNASFSWDKSTQVVDKPALRNLNLSFPPNKLSIVCGPTGSGKTTLLASLLGETHCQSGSAILPRQRVSHSNTLGGAVSGIAYVAQTAWLQNCSIKDNILFGLPLDEQRYQDVLYMTALTRDIDILEFGDSTEVGEKGITLSGGQKQRVAIARAVYSQATTVILDDCLSAVDAHTAKHLFDHCLTGRLMKDRTVILVTHHVGLCLKAAAYIVALKDGEVAEAGDPAVVLKSGVLGEELAHAEEEHVIEEEEAALDGPIRSVHELEKKEKKNGAGKLTQEEARATGSVALSVYASYFYASGGFFFWIMVLFLFCLAQACVLGQDYWIKVWASAYGTSEPIDGSPANASLVGSFSIARFGSMETTMMTTSYNSHPFGTLVSDDQDNKVDVKYYLGIYFLIGIVALVVSSLRTYILYQGSLSASRNIHSQLLDRILRAKVRFFDTTPMGRIVNRFSSDLATIDQEVGPSLSYLLFAVAATLCVVILVSCITPAFLIPGTVITILFWLIGSYYLKTSRDLKRLNSVSRSPIYVQFGEAVNGVATIRAFGGQNRFIQENFNKIDSNNRPFLWMWATNRWLHCRVDTLGAFVSFCTGFVLVMSRSWIDPGLAGLSLSYALTFTVHVLWVVRMYAVNEMNMNAIERVDEYMSIEEEPAIHIPETTPPPNWPATGSVKVENLVMQYSPENPPVLRDISFNVKPMEKVGIVGRTGSGKSTLALSLFRFMEPTSGRILIDGVDIHTIGLEDLRSRLTIIPQDPVLFSGTLRSNLDPFGQHTDIELWAAIKRAHLADDSQTENAITLDAPVTENGNNWSQGQRQLIALARALVKKSSLIVLDEATSSVDFDTDHKIQETIRTEFVNSALLCIAHRIRTVADYDRILVLDHGKVVEYDTPYKLMIREGGVFQSMCNRSGEYAELLAIAKAKHEA